MINHFVFDGFGFTKTMCFLVFFDLKSDQKGCLQQEIHIEAQD